MDVRLRECKRAIRIFLRTAYKDEQLAWLLAHARAGRLAYNSCCCLVGLVTADHALRGRVAAGEIPNSHYTLAKRFLGASEAERAYRDLALIGKFRRCSADELRRRRLIPLIRAEMRRRTNALVERKFGPAPLTSRSEVQTDFPAELNA